MACNSPLTTNINQQSLIVLLDQWGYRQTYRQTDRDSCRRNQMHCDEIKTGLTPVRSALTMILDKMTIHDQLMTVRPTHSSTHYHVVYCWHRIIPKTGQHIELLCNFATIGMAYTSQCSLYKRFLSFECQWPCDVNLRPGWKAWKERLFLEVLLSKLSQITMTTKDPLIITFSRQH